MNEDNVIMLLRKICVYYPNFKMVDLEETTDAWSLVLQDADVREVLKNLATHVKTNPFPPTIADLLKIPKEESRGRYIPNIQETRLMLEQMDRDRENVATEEEKRAGLAGMKAILLANGARKQ